MSDEVKTQHPAQQWQPRSKRNITSVYIRGLAFKCTLGGRREQVLLKLKKADEKDTDWLALLAVACFVGGFGAGVLAAWYL
jgi:hypothetical protein